MTVSSLRRYTAILSTSSRQQWTYRSELVFRAIQMVLFMSVFMALWFTAYGVSGQPTLQGFTVAQMVWYLAMTETIALSSSRIFIDISEAVKAGDLAYTLTRPLRYPLFQIASSLGNSAPRVLLNLLTASIVVGLGTQRIAGSILGLISFLGLALLALILDAMIAVLIGLAAFWLEEVDPIYWIYQKLLFTLGGLFLPLELFPDWLQSVARWLPFQFITYAPARSFVAFESSFVLRSLAGQLVYIVVFGLLLRGVWDLARKRLVVHGG